MTTTVTSAAPVERPRRTLLPGLSKASVLYLLALILVLFGLWIPETFLTQATFKIVLADQVVIGILALAVLVPLTAGAFDLSVRGDAGVLPRHHELVPGRDRRQRGRSRPSSPSRHVPASGSCPAWSSSSSGSTRSSPRSA